MLRVASALGATLFILVAVVAPFLVEGDAVRKQLKEKLEAWSGGKVEHLGRIELASFLALSVKVSDVKLSSVRHLGPVSGIDAPQLKAVIAFSELLSGSLRFEKLLIKRPDVAVSEERWASLRQSTGLDEVNRTLAKLDGGVFGVIVIQNARLLRGDGAVNSTTKPVLVRTLTLEGTATAKRLLKGQTELGGQSIKFSFASRPVSSGETSIQASLKSPAFEASFSGHSLFDLSGFSGEVRLSVRDAAALSQLSGMAEIAQWRGPIAVSGALAFDGAHWALEHASLQIGRCQGTGFLSLASVDGRMLLEGTTSWSRLYLDDILPAVMLSGLNPSHAQTGGTAPLVTAFDADLRVSADYINGYNQVLNGPAAAITIKQGRLSADFAEFNIFGGLGRGRLEADLRTGALLALGASIEGAELAQVTAAISSMPIAGNADIAVDLHFPPDSAPWERNVEGRVRVSVAEGATLGEAASREILASLVNDTRPMQPLRTPVVLHDAKLSAEMARGSAALSLTAMIPGEGLARASGTLDLASQQIEGRIDILPDASALETTASIASAVTARRTPLIFKGTPAQLQLTSEKASRLSN